MSALSALQPCRRFTSLTRSICLLLLLVRPPWHAQAQMTGALSNGLSAAAAARGGTLSTEEGDPLDAIEGNPAGLAGVHARVLEAGGFGAVASGSFRNRVDPGGRLTGGAGAIPIFAFATPLERRGLSAGAAFTPEMLMRAHWKYVDPPGTAGASYGQQTNESEILALRSTVGLGWSMGRRWMAGATVGLVYNRNTMHAPYIFQEQPALAGLKVLLDLHTSGWGWNGSAGAQWQATDRLRVGAAWKSGTSILSQGQAQGTASAQFAALGIGADPAFHYRAMVANHLPQTAALGVAWKEGKRAVWAVDGGWAGWGDAFHKLPVTLSQGTNAAINSVVGASAFKDTIALNWRDQYSVRAGVEAPVAERWTLRGGYGWMSDPVPGSTLTPMTAAILRHSLAAGTGWSGNRWGLDLAYQAQLPASRSVGGSALRAGEYSNTRVQVRTQALTITVRKVFPQ